MTIDTSIAQSSTPDAGQAAFRAELIEAEVLTPTSVDGLYLRSATFEHVARGLEGMLAHARPAGYAPLTYFPPLMPREDFIKTDYLRSFPDLTGSISTFLGGDTAHAELLDVAQRGGDWSAALTPAEVMLCSAACHPLYATLQGKVPADGRRFEVQGYCFRHEPSLDPCRMQTFRQHEFVVVGAPDQAIAHRDEWLDRGLALLSGLRLPVERVLANDPFFGRAGRMLAANQKNEALKFEIVCPVTSAEKPTAISSANYHMDHFGLPFGIYLPDGEPAHSACIGFGLERITLALLRHHGMRPDSWPAAVRSQLWA